MSAETLLVPYKIRQRVIERDGSCCRVCGRHVDRPGLHHIEYKSEGGKNTAANLVVVGWLPGHDCHIPIVHADKGLWQPLLKALVTVPSLGSATALQLRRWLREGASPAAFGLPEEFHVPRH